MKTVTFDFKDGDKLELRDIHANDKPEEAVIKFNSFEVIEIYTCGESLQWVKNRKKFTNYFLQYFSISTFFNNYINQDNLITAFFLKIYRFSIFQ